VLLLSGQGCSQLVKLSSWPKPRHFMKRPCVVPVAPAGHSMGEETKKKPIKDVSSFEDEAQQYRLTNPMKRRLFNILSAMSLLLCVVVLVLWVLSIWVTTRWGYCGKGGGPYFLVCSLHGCIDVNYVTLYTGHGKPLTGFAAFPAYALGYIPHWWDYLFFGVQNATTATELSRFIIPDWFVCSITAVFPCLWYRSYRQRRIAERKGLCPKCGYDLRATPDRCPECGTPVIPTEADSQSRRSRAFHGVQN
jgi:hypothetical protein